MTEENVFSNLGKKERAINRQKEKLNGDERLASLSAMFFSDNKTKNSAINAVPKHEIVELAISDIQVNPQVRTHFDDNEIKALAESIAENGLLQPIVVRPENGKYTLICGEKRLRACDSLGETTIKSIINDKELTPQQILALQIVENLQRSDPPIVDLSVAIRRMSEECLLSIDEIGKLISMKKTNVYNLIAISKLSDYEKETFKEMGITFLRSYVAFRNAHTDSDVVERFINRCNQALADLEITGDPEENTKEKRVALITTIFENVTADLKKIKAKEIAADKKKRDEEQEPELAIGKKLSLSWDKIDKIEPDLSVQLNDFLKENEDYKLETVVAEAISQYLKSMNGTL